MLAVMEKGRLEALGELRRCLLRHAREGARRADFFSSVMDALRDFCRCSTVTLLLRENEGLTRWEVDASSKKRSRIAEVEARDWSQLEDSAAWSFDQLCRAVMWGQAPSRRGRMTESRSYYDQDWPFARQPHGRTVASAVMVVPLQPDDGAPIGVMGLRLTEPLPFDDDDGIRFFEGIADAVASAMMHHRVQWALRERVKELTCLYGISRVAELPNVPETTLLQRIVELLPHGWQYPEITSAAIVLDDEVVAMSGPREGRARQVADVMLYGVPRGRVEVIYMEERPEFDEGPFLREERSLIQEVARQVGAMLERKQTEQRKTAHLHEQLRHADRLATIGQLAAGTAHELNEPLGAILGFAQLAKKHPKVPAEVDRDLDRIVKASLHAREVIRQLMLFARQTPPQMTQVALHTIIKEALVLVRGRLQRRGIRVDRRFARSLPKVAADPGQLQQVIVNLVVNAAQAMPHGGTLSIISEKAKNGVMLIVADTGVGLSEEMKSQIFMPFFTTKDVGQGTGLGLSVVHGIVSAHGGNIRVTSRVGKGTRFEVFLPTEKPTTPSNQHAQDN